MVANEVNKFGQNFPIHRRRKYVQGYGVISILLISPPKFIYAELLCVKDTPHFFSKLFSESPCIFVKNLRMIKTY
jgi:hypothetical protein